MERNLASLAAQDHDLVIVGGGIYGGAAAREATLRGLRVALVERGDFGCGTSWNSYKTIHGGFRYLQKLDLPRVVASIRERRRFLGLAPHLVRPLEFAIPTYGMALRSRAALLGAMLLYAGLGANRNRGLLHEREMRNPRLLSCKALRERLPGLDTNGFSGAAAWTDVQMQSSERVVLGTLQAAADAGACVANHVEATGWLQDPANPLRVRGIRARDAKSGESFDVRGRAVLNCAGPDAWSLLRKGSGDHSKSPSLSRAVNVVLRRDFCRGGAVGLEVKGACTASGKQMLVIAPWRGRTLLGTLHLRPNESASATVSAAEIERLLDAVNREIPSAKLKMDEVAVVHTGVQAVAGWDERTGHAKHLTKAFNLDHAREGGPEGLVTLVGVKFTEAGGAAQRAVDGICEQLGRERRNPPPPAPALPGGEMESLTALRAEMAVALAQFPGGCAALDEECMDHLVTMYGTAAPRVLQAAAGDREHLERVTPESPVIGAQVVYSLRHEMALGLDDIVMRRTELGARGDADERAIDRCGAIAAREAGWSEARLERELTALGDALQRSRIGFENRDGDANRS